MKPLPPYRLFRTSVNSPLTSSVSVGSSVTELPDTKVSAEHSEFITSILGDNSDNSLQGR